MLPKLAGPRLAESTAERATEAAGALLAARCAAGEVLGPACDWAWDKDALGRTCAYVSVDATGVGMPGPGGQPARERALAGLYGLDELGPQLRRQGAQVGMDRADVWVALTDGGAGLEGFMGVYFPRAVCVLDFYHAAEHLNDLARALYPGDADKAGVWCHRLKHEGGAALLEPRSAGRSGPARRRRRRRLI